MALVEGVKYGLSGLDNNNGSCSSINSGKAQSANQTNSGTSKSVIFVKLTDSALKAIEDYLRSQHKTGQQPATLQFLGNEGRIHIPSSEGSKGRFDFSLSSNADIEGPQGSFECIQQCGSSTLKSMGTVPFKMRVQANEDVYETTRQKMNALEETRKHDCAKEIKPNGADIGRRVKKKLSRSSIPPPISQYQNNRQSPSPNYRNNHFKSQVNKPINGHNPTPFNNQSSTNNHATGTHHSPSSNNHFNNFIRNTTNNAPNGNSANKPNGGGDVTRRPLRDRLIHLLALKAYKKPELVARLHKDGLKDKDKKLMMPLLSQMTALRNNEYILNRGIWNDIQEDWPFYTEQEKQIMKRRKPQNLTPPGSDSSVSSVSSLSSLSPRSSVSNGSGHSPPGSYLNKSHGANEPFHIPGAKRPSPLGGFELEGGENSKRQRISHFKRPSSSSSSNQHHSNSIPSANSREKDYPYHSPSSLPNRFTPISNGHNQHSNERLSPSRPNGPPPNGNHQIGPPDIGLSPQSYEYPTYPWHGTRNIDHAGYEEGVKLPDDETDSIDSGNGGSSCSSGSGKSDYTNGSLAGNYVGVGKSTPDPIDPPSTNGYHGSTGSLTNLSKDEPESVYETPEVYVPENHQVAVKDEPRSSGFKTRGKDRSRDKEVKKEAKHEKSRERLTTKNDQPTYLNTFLPICTPEQRSRYRAEFSADYKEYMRVHSVIDKVSKRFAHLDERLRQAEKGSHEYKMVTEQIIQEYTSNKSDSSKEEARRKFQYLHGKLSHIKGLVLEYDSTHSNSDYGSQQEDYV